MFTFFKKKTPLQKLEENYKKLLHEAFLLSKYNRTQSDKKYAEAQDVLLKIEEFNQS